MAVTRAQEDAEGQASTSTEMNSIASSMRCVDANSSNVGAIRLHGPHHVAVKSTTVKTSERFTRAKNSSSDTDAIAICTCYICTYIFLCQFERAYMMSIFTVRIMTARMQTPLCELVICGRGCTLDRAPPGLAGACLDEDPPSCAIGTIADLPLPSELLDMYRNVDDTCEFYLSRVIFLSPSTMRARITDVVVFAAEYGTQREARLWMYDPKDECVWQRFEKTDTCPMSFVAFLSQKKAEHLQALAQAECMYRRKCVNGRYVPSPELHPNHSGDDDDYSD